MSYLVILLATLTAVAAAQSLPSIALGQAGLSAAKLKRMHAYYEGLVKNGTHSGVITMLVRDGKIADWKAFGYRDLAAKLPMEKDTIARLYSMTKPIATVAALTLVEEGKLSLRDPVDKYVPELKDMRVYDAQADALVPLKRPITIKHLMTHTSGFAYANFGYPRVVDEAYKKANLLRLPSLRDFAKAAAGMPLVAQPGQSFNYGISTDILSYVVEQVSGMPFDQFVAERVLRPLKMNDTSFVVPEQKRTRLAKVYFTGADGKLAEQPFVPFTFPGGGFAAYGTIGDYARFAQMLLNGGELEGVRVLSRRMVALMTENHLAGLALEARDASGSEGFGLGLAVRREVGRGAFPGSVGEYGWSGAANTFFRVDPKERTISLIFMQHVPFSIDVLETFQTLWSAALD